MRLLPGAYQENFVVSPWNFPRAEAFFRGYGFHIVMGGRYIEGFLGSKAAQDR